MKGQSMGMFTARRAFALGLIAGLFAGTTASVYAMEWACQRRVAELTDLYCSPSPAAEREANAIKKQEQDVRDFRERYGRYPEPSELKGRR